jgi:magnesium chelatase subunit I
MKINPSEITTLGQLKNSGYLPKSIKKEMRDNLISKIKKKEKLFDGIMGYDDTFRT